MVPGDALLPVGRVQLFFVWRINNSSLQTDNDGVFLGKTSSVLLVLMVDLCVLSSTF